MDTLIKIALDDSDDVNVRVQAAYAVRRIGDKSHVNALRPLLYLERSSDPSDELLGIALSGLLEFQLISGQPLFDVLPRPQRRSFFGAYRYFLQVELPDSLSIADVESGLRWCAKQPRQSTGLDEFADAEERIVALALRNLQDQRILEAFAVYCVSRMERHDAIPAEHNAFQALSDELRRKLLKELLSQMPDADKCFIESLGLIQPHDFDWLLKQGSIATTERSKYAKLIRRQYSYRGFDVLDAIIDECEANEVLRQEFSSVLEPVEIGSEKAAELKKSFQASLGLELQLAELDDDRRVDPPPEIRVERCLQRYEQGELDAWWQLLHEMQLTADGIDTRCTFEDDITAFPGWHSASGETQARIASAAKDYLLKWRSNPKRLLRNNLYYPDMAGYRAFVLIHKLCPEFLRPLGHCFWANLAPTAVAFPISSGMGGDSESRQRSIIAMVYARSPQRVIRSLHTLIDYADAEGHHLSVLGRIDDCLDRNLALVLIDKARDLKLQPASVAELIGRAFAVCPAEAEARARARLIGCLAQLRSKNGRSYQRVLTAKRRTHFEVRQNPTVGLRPGRAVNANGRRRLLDLALNLVSVIWKNGSQRWHTLWPIWSQDMNLFRLSIRFLASEGRQSRAAPGDLTEANLGDLYIRLSQAFPHEIDPQHDGAYWSDSHDSAVEFRETVLKTLQAKGTSAAISEMERIEAEFPHLDNLAWMRRNTKKLMVETTWTPPAIEHLKSLTAQAGRRLIRSESDLAAVVLESLDRLQKRLHGETPSCRDLWDLDRITDSWAPIDENDLANYLKRYLHEDLSTTGIIALREVEVERGYDGVPGERTDIYVVAAVYRGETSNHALFRVILEVKGCWHRELKTALDEQLRGRYLKESSCATGIYVVGWYLCDAWRKDDYRRGQTPKWSLEDATSFFRGQASQASVDGISISAIVLDARLN